jgi:hypothetical protein
VDDECLACLVLGVSGACLLPAPQQVSLQVAHHGDVVRVHQRYAGVVAEPVGPVSGTGPQGVMEMDETVYATPRTICACSVHEWQASGRSALSPVAPITRAEITPGDRAMAAEGDSAAMIVEGILPGNPDYARGVEAWIMFLRALEPLPRWARLAAGQQPRRSQRHSR